jgi:alpha-N-arabinofuranosidase
VQKLYANNRGTDLLSITHEGKAIIGQQNLYASAVKDTETREVIVKVVNTSADPKSIKIDLEGGKIGNKGQLTLLRSDDLQAVNSFESPKNIRPVASEIRARGTELSVQLPSKSLAVLKFPIR